MEMEYPNSGITLPSLLTEEEKWLFDLNGFLIKKNAVDKQKINDIVSISLDWLENPEKVSKPVTVRELDHNGGQIVWPQYGSRLYEELVQTHDIMRVVLGLMFNRPRLFHYDLILSRKKKDYEKELVLMHKDHSGFEFPPGMKNPHNDYQVSDGNLYCSFLNVAFSLKDDPEGTGFGCVPGSHKSNIKCPDTITADSDNSNLRSFNMEAGDAIIFSSGLIHTSMPWNQDYPRMTVFARFQFRKYFNENPSGGLPVEEYKDKISEIQYDLESMGTEEILLAKNFKEKL